MEAAPPNIDNRCNGDFGMPAAYLRLVDNRTSDQSLEDLPI